MHSLLLLLLMASPAHARLRPNGDADRDGLTNYEESSVYQTNPRRSNTDRDGDSDYTEVLYSSAPPDPTQGIDDDGDSLYRYYELYYGTDPNDPDSDGDGQDDYTEVLYGTDPLDAASH
jgi:hypothetical protein